MPDTSFRFPKSSRLYLRKEIKELFVSGKTLNASPFKVLYKFLPELRQSLQMTVAVPKRNIRNAVDRNRIKRQVREAFRLNCPGARSYFEKQKMTVHILLIYNGKVLPDYAVLTSKIILILQRLQEMHEKGAV